MSKTETKGPGRPSVVGKVINANLLQFRNKTPKEFVNFVLPKVQHLMKGGVTTDEKTIQKQKTSLYQGVLRKYNEALRDGKKVEFSGRMQGGVLRKKWVRSVKRD